MEQSKWNSPSGTVQVEQSKWNSPSGTVQVEQSKWNSPSGTVQVEQSKFPNSDSWNRPTPHILVIKNEEESTFLDCSKGEIARP